MASSASHPFKGFKAELLPDSILSKLKPSPYGQSLTGIARGETGAVDTFVLTYPADPETPDQGQRLSFFHRQQGTAAESGWEAGDAVDFDLGDGANYGEGFDAGKGMENDWKSVPFDYNSCGRLDHLFLWRPQIGRGPTGFWELEYRIATWSGGAAFSPKSLTSYRTPIPENWLLDDPEVQDHLVELDAVATSLSIDFNTDDIVIDPVTGEQVVRPGINHHLGSQDHIFLYLRQWKRESVDGGGPDLIHGKAGLVLTRDEAQPQRLKDAFRGKEFMVETEEGTAPSFTWTSEHPLSLQSTALLEYGRKNAILLYGQTDMGIYFFLNAIFFAQWVGVITPHSHPIDVEGVRQKQLCLANPLTGDSNAMLIFGRGDLDPELGYRKPVLTMLDSHSFYTDDILTPVPQWTATWDDLVGADASPLLTRVPAEHLEARMIDYDGIGLETHVVITSVRGGSGDSDGTAMPLTAILLSPVWESEPYVPPDADENEGPFVEDSARARTAASSRGAAPVTKDAVREAVRQMEGRMREASLRNGSDAGPRPRKLPKRFAALLGA